MITAVKTLIKELKEHENEYVIFIISLIIPGIICLLGFNVFLEITESVDGQKLILFDARVTDFLYQFRSEKMTRFVTFITDLGDLLAYLLIIPAIAVLLYYRGHHRWRLSLQAIIVLASASALNVLLKEAISRPRPMENLRLVMADSYSFPSGHSMSAIAFYGFLIYLTYLYVRSTALKTVLIVLQGLLILAIGISRIYLGVHFPTDVAAGFILGLIWLILCIAIFNFVNIYRLRKAKRFDVDPLDPKADK